MEQAKQIPLIEECRLGLGLIKIGKSKYLNCAVLVMESEGHRGSETVMGHSAPCLLGGVGLENPSCSALWWLWAGKLCWGDCARVCSVDPVFLRVPSATPVCSGEGAQGLLGISVVFCCSVLSPLLSDGVQLVPRLV